MWSQPYRLPPLHWPRRHTVLPPICEQIWVGLIFFSKWNSQTRLLNSTLVLEPSGKEELWRQAHSQSSEKGKGWYDGLQDDRQPLRSRLDKLCMIADGGSKVYAVMSLSSEVDHSGNPNKLNDSGAWENVASKLYYPFSKLHQGSRSCCFLTTSRRKRSRFCSGSPLFHVSTCFSARTPAPQQGWQPGHWRWGLPLLPLFPWWRPVCMHATFVGSARTIYTRWICGNSGRNSSDIRSYTVYIYGSGQP